MLEGMRLSTLRGHSTREKARRVRDDMLAGIARRLPRRLRYWVLITAGVGTILDHEEVPAVPYTVVLQRFGDELEPRRRRRAAEWREPQERQAQLGCATTQELIAELAARADVSATIGEDWPRYRTVDSQ